ncbi:ATP-dependent DNA ligase [Granulicella sibirica]|uniref:DNA ligase n=1 Tax=Granulicella sibirica TaxID=2479048 RepID=A0A4Q0T5F7_9BACT|nr:ATP-dependent DNA ligase [Granulicella sibirica]RXH58637.1 ATP-dependent DNA ligase [Granulicella sibirica]
MAQFHAVATLAETLAGEGSRLKKRAAIADAICRAAQEGPNSGISQTSDAGLFALYLAGLPFSEADPRKLNAGGAIVTRAVLAVSGATDAALSQAYRRHGDLGAAAFDLLAGTPDRAPDLTLTQVSESLSGMATAKTTAVRSALLEDLLCRATPIEAKYLIKLMLGDMRIGVKQSLVEEAIAVAASTARHEDLATDVAAVRHAVMLEADLGRAVDRAFAGTLDEARMRLFHPLGFMLASPVESPEEAVARFTQKPEKPAKPAKKPRKSKKAADADLEVEEAVAEIELDLPRTDGQVDAFLEDKYDGMRAQVHCGDPSHPGRVAIYSRNREDVTESFPELAEAFAAVKHDVDGAMILDGEILAWNFGTDAGSLGNTARALPFAILGTRIGRKKVSNEVRTQIPVVFMAFDLMYAKDELQLSLPLRDRRNRLEAIVEQMIDRVVSPLAVDERRKESQQAMFLGEEGAGVPRLMLSPSRLVESAEDIDRAYADARARANEGVMLKAAGSAYLPGRRGLAWVKLKRELATLDVVITGAEYGNGRRAAFLSDYTFAVRSPEGELLNVGKAYSGVTDAEVVELTELLKAHTLEDQGHFRTVEPLVILEVAFNNIMRSGRHASGFALRFPRIIRIRTDKPLEEIDTVERVEEVYMSQVDRPVEPAP